MAKPQTIVLFFIGTVAIIVVLAAGMAGKDWIREEWYIRKLSAPDEKERTVAADRLGELQSVRAAPFLVQALTQATSHTAVEGLNGLVHFIGDPDQELGKFGVSVRNAIVRIGRPATIDLLRAIKEQGASFSTAYYYMALVEIYKSWLGGGSFAADSGMSGCRTILRRLRDEQGQSSEIRRISAEILARDYGT